MRSSFDAKANLRVQTAPSMIQLLENLDVLMTVCENKSIGKWVLQQGPLRKDIAYELCLEVYATR
jgi:hypothetical protein